MSTEGVKMDKYQLQLVGVSKGGLLCTDDQLLCQATWCEARRRT